VTTQLQLINIIIIIKRVPGIFPGG